MLDLNLSSKLDKINSDVIGSTHTNARLELKENTLEKVTGFESLVPDLVMGAVENALGFKLSGFISPLPSYINRVYELQSLDETRWIVKFYRPHRWTTEAIQEEHDFVFDCVDNEIPAIAPLKDPGGQSLFQYQGYNFAVFPKKQGRMLELNSDLDWRRVGTLIGRVHASGSKRDTQNRVILHPLESTAKDLDELGECGYISKNYQAGFIDLGKRILERIIPLFEDTEFIRIHGDCHAANILDRLDEGYMLIDFDDMVMGPPVQDLWLLMPDRVENCRRELNLFIEGYEQFREFDDTSFDLIEPLRIMRIIYFLAWCARQYDDFQFKNHFPNWGSEDFWAKEVRDLERQFTFLPKTKRSFGKY